MALKTFLGTDGILRDEDGNEILITNTDDRNAIVGEVVPVDIGTRPNANDGDPLRTSFSKLNNFVLASYQNDSDVQTRVGALEAGAVFLGIFRADQLPRRSLPLRDSGAGGAWIAADRYPDSSGDIYSELRADAVPNLEDNPDATDVYAQISRPITGRPNLSVVIDNIRDVTTDGNGNLTITIAFPTEITELDVPSAISTQTSLSSPNTNSNFPALQIIVNVDNSSAQDIAEIIRDELTAKESDENADYFSFNIEAPTESTRRLTIDFNVKAAVSSTVLIPKDLITIISATALDTYRGLLDLTSNGNTRGTGIAALPWIDQDITASIIPAYTIFQWTRDGWSIADQGRGDINAEFLFFDDERTTVAISTDFTDATGGSAINAKPEDVTTPSSKEIDTDATRDAIIDVQQFGIDYIHSVTIDAGEY